MSEPALKVIDKDSVMQEVVSVEAQARTLQIVDSQSYVNAGEFWKSIKDLRKKIADTFDANIKKAHELHKNLLAEKKKHDDPLNAAERTIKKAMADYDAEQERKRREEQRRIEEVARKAEEERLLAEAIAAEEAAKAAGATQEEAQAEAEQIISQPVYVPPVVIPKAVPKMQGGPVFRTIWKCRIVDPTIVPREYMIIDIARIGQVIRASKGMARIPGIEAYEERV